MLEDDTKLEYDGLLISTGSTYKIRAVENLTGNDKAFYLRNKHDHQRIRQKLEEVRSVAIVGISPKSMEFCSTLKKEYPHIKVTMLDENKKCKLENKFGETIHNEMLDYLLRHQVESFTGLKIDKVEDTGKSLVFDLEDDTIVSGDIAVLFPSNEVGNTVSAVPFSGVHQRRLGAGPGRRRLHQGRLRVQDRDQEDLRRWSLLEHRLLRHPPPGKCALTKMPVDEWSAAYHQGYTAAYNLLALVSRPLTPENPLPQDTI